MKKVLYKIFIVLSGLLFTVSIFAVLISKWLLKTWANLTMDELMFHMTANLDGTSPDIIRNAILSYGLPALLLSAAYITGLVLLRKKKKFQVMLAVLGILLSLVFALVTFIRLDNKLMIVDYINKQKKDSSFIEENYVDPRNVEMVFPEQKRNLIYIYLESMEVTYADEANGGYFQENVIPELTKLAQENEDFSGPDDELNGGISYVGCTYTMGALFSQSCGLPLKTGISRNDMDTQDEFFPGMVALGDILKEQGYTNELMIGSKGNFGGRQLYFQKHGDFQIFDYDYAVKLGYIPSNYYRWWGYEDEKLFTYAQEELLRLDSEGQPFNLTMLTVDTHFEDGYVCERCGNKFGNDQYSNVFACSSCQVYEFVEWIQQQDFYDNTTIIICGDHPTMDADYCVNVPDSYTRKVYTCVINPAVQVEDGSLYRDYSTLDMFPTTLAALGVEIEGNRLGLGTNLFSSEKTLTEMYGADYVEDYLGMNSPFLNSLNTVSITDNYINRVATRSALYVEYSEPQNDMCEVLVSIDTYTKLTASTLIERVEIEVGYDETILGPYTLSGFEADGNIYFTEETIKVPSGRDVTVYLYIVGTDGERYYIKEAVSSSDNPIVFDREPKQTTK